MTKGKTYKLISPGLGLYVFVRGLRRAYNRGLVTGINKELRNKP